MVRTVQRLTAGLDRGSRNLDIQISRFLLSEPKCCFLVPNLPFLEPSFKNFECCCGLPFPSQSIVPAHTHAHTLSFARTYQTRNCSASVVERQVAYTQLHRGRSRGADCALRLRTRRWAGCSRLSRALRTVSDSCLALRLVILAAGAQITRPPLLTRYNHPPAQSVRAASTWPAES